MYNYKIYNIIIKQDLKYGVGIDYLTFPTENEFYGIHQKVRSEITLKNNKIECLLTLSEENINQVIILNKTNQPIIGIDLIQNYNRNICEQLKINIYLNIEIEIVIEPIKIDMKEHYEKEIFPHSTLIQSDFGKYKLYGLEQLKVNESQYFKVGRIDFNTISKKTVDELFELYTDSGKILDDNVSFNLIWNQITIKNNLSILYQHINLGQAITNEHRLTIHPIFGVLLYDKRKIYGNSVYNFDIDIDTEGYDLLYYPSVFLDYNKKVYQFKNSTFLYNEYTYESYLTRWVENNSKIVSRNINFAQEYYKQSHDFEIAPIYNELNDKFDFIIDEIIVYVKNYFMTEYDELIIGRNAIIIESKNNIKWIPITIDFVNNISLFSASKKDLLCYTDLYNGIYLRYSNSKKPLIFQYNGKVIELEENIICISNAFYNMDNGEYIVNFN